MKKPHFDGWGHRTLGYFEMMWRFDRDPASLAILRQFAPYKYVVMPDIEINVKKGVTDELDVALYWPGETKRFYKKSNKRSLSALRELARSKRAGWTILVKKEGVTFFRRGKVIPNKKAVDYSLPSKG